MDALVIRPEPQKSDNPLPGPRAGRSLGWLAAAVLVAACDSKGSAASGPGPAARPVPVTVASVVEKDVPVVVRGIGTVESIATVEVVSQVTGLVMDVHFKEGDFVKRGDLLFTIDTRPYSSTLAAARAQLQKDQALFAQAKDDAERAARLAREGLASEQDQLRANANQAAYAAALEADKAQIGSASINVQFTQIRSPLDGRTGSLLVYPGNVVKTNETKPLVVIRSLVPIYVRFSLPEDYLPQIRARMRQGTLTARATPRGEGGKTVEGKLTFIENAVDSATGTIALKAEFTNQEHELWPGEFVDVALTLALDKNALVVPEAAVQTGQDGPYVFRVEGDTVALRRVALKHIMGEDAVLNSGVKPGEQVVTDGQIRLRPGARVTIKPSAPVASTEPADIDPPQAPGASNGNRALSAERGAQ